MKADGVVRQLAVELDTYMNEFDPDGNFTGIDTTSTTKPVAAKSLNSTGIDLKSGREINIKIHYDGHKQMLMFLWDMLTDPSSAFLPNLLSCQNRF